MQIEVLQILQGKVSGITKFGAFVDLGEGKTGMIHISEVAAGYVKEISDYLKVGQEVRVKVVSIAPDGKISLSIKQAEDKPQKKSVSQPLGKNYEWAPLKTPAENMSFEDMLGKYKQSSEEKIGELKRSVENKRGGNTRRGR